MRLGWRANGRPRRPPHPLKGSSTGPPSSIRWVIGGCSAFQGASEPGRAHIVASSPSVGEAACLVHSLWALDQPSKFIAKILWRRLEYSSLYPIDQVAHLGQHGSEVLRVEPVRNNGARSRLGYKDTNDWIRLANLRWDQRGRSLTCRRRAQTRYGGLGELRLPIVARNSAGGVATCSINHSEERRGSRSAVSKGRSRSVARKPSALCAIASSQVTPAGPPTTAAPKSGGVPPSLKARAGATLAHRRTRAPPRRAELRDARPHSRPRDRTPQRTGALATAEGQPHPKRAPRAPETRRLRSPSFSPSCAEVRTGFEPAYNGFANRCLTAWLPHHAWKRGGPCHELWARSMVAAGSRVSVRVQLAGRIVLEFRGGRRMSAGVIVASGVTGGVSFGQKLDCAWERPRAVLCRQSS